MNHKLKDSYEKDEIILKSLDDRELIARSLHYFDTIVVKPFVTVNCNHVSLIEQKYVTIIL